MTFYYYNPVNIVFGVGSLQSLAKCIAQRKALLVTSPSFVKRGLVEKIQNDTGSIVHVVSNIKPNPEIQNLQQIYESLFDVEFDVIIALGGGSVIDSAKVLSVYNEKKSFEFVDELIRNKQEKSGYSLIPIIAIPTTSGTGSELTPWATVWDMEEKKKYSLHLPDLFPETAICDPELTLTVPKNITIQTGLDTLSHALESIWNKNASPVTIPHAISAAKKLMAFLPKLSDDLSNLAYRTEIMLACVHAGLAFSNTATATAHAMSYYITAHKGTPHGIACSFTLPNMVDALSGEYKWLDDIFIDLFGCVSSEPIRSFFKTLGVSSQLSDYNLSNNEMQTIKSSLKSNVRAANGIVDIEKLFRLF